jgi:hypothetical protein
MEEDQGQLIGGRQMNRKKIYRTVMSLRIRTAVTLRMDSDPRLKTIKEQDAWNGAEEGWQRTSLSAGSGGEVW